MTTFLPYPMSKLILSVEYYRIFMLPYINIFKFFINFIFTKGRLDTMIKLLLCDLEISDLDNENNLFCYKTG